MFRAFQNLDNKKIAKILYTIVINQARRKEFYLNYGVADTIDGRFDMILLHSYLLFNRLKTNPKKTKKIAQAVFDLMFADMETNLRELGVGDIGVSHRIKGMVRAFYGRVKVYDEGLSEENPSVLEQALVRNLFRKTTPKIYQIQKLSDYIRNENKFLNTQTISDLLAGNLFFNPPP